MVASRSHGFILAEKEAEDLSSEFCIGEVELRTWKFIFRKSFQKMMSHYKCDTGPL